MWDIMIENINSSLDEICPMKNFKIKKYKEPWISQELLELIKDKDSLLKKAKQSKLPADWEIAKRYRNDCLSSIRRAKADFVTSELENNKNDTKKFWKNIKDILPLNSKSKKKITLINPEVGEDINDPDTASYINEFFANIGQKLSANFKTPWFFDGQENGNKIHTIVATNEEVLTCCTDIDISKSACVENISCKVLKDALIHLNVRFTDLLNTSFITGIFPNTWKCARVTPLFKGGDRNFVGNYRPVSLLPLPSKIIVHNKLVAFFDENNILDPNQGGFRKGHSTINTISNLTNDIFNGINSGNLTMSCFIDMAKAFDTVNHSILCKKLSKFGITGGLLIWIKNYLAMRKQCTCANGIVSSYLDV